MFNQVRLNGRVPVEGQIARVILRGNDLDLKDVALHSPGGSFRGDVQLRKLDTYVVSGEVQDFEARRTVAMYSKQALPWDARASGTILLEGSLRRKEDLRATFQLALAPASGSAPVHGQITATYEERKGIVDLGRSTVTLPEGLHTQSNSATLSAARFRLPRSDTYTRCPSRVAEATIVRPAISV